MTVGTALIVIAAVAAVIVGLRVRSASHAAAAGTPAHPLDVNGVFEGAASIRLDGTGTRGAVILHGFNDTPQSVAELTRALHSRGWSVSVPLLPGHGRADDRLDRTGTADEWIAHARAEWIAMRARVPNAVLCGQSMGGAIAAILAAEAPPRALVLLAPYLAMSRGVRFWATIWPLWQLAVPKLVVSSRGAYRDRDAGGQSLGRTRFAPRLVAELKRVVDQAREALPQANAPSLVLHSVTDYRIPSPSAAWAFNRLGAADKTLVWRTDTGHVLAADRGREEVFVLVCDWLDTRVPR